MANNGKDFWCGTIVGGLIGAAAALLLAPKAGRDTRSDLNRQWVTVKGKTQEVGRTVKHKAKEVGQTVREQSGDIVEKIVYPKGDSGEEMQEAVSDMAEVVEGAVKDTVAQIEKESEEERERK